MLNPIGPLYLFLEILSHTLGKFFGRKLTPEEIRNLEEQRRKEARKSLAIATAILISFSLLLILALRHYSKIPN